MKGYWLIPRSVFTIVFIKQIFDRKHIRIWIDGPPVPLMNARVVIINETRTFFLKIPPTDIIWVYKFRVIIDEVAICHITYSSSAD